MSLVTSDMLKVLLYDYNIDFSSFGTVSGVS